MSLQEELQQQRQGFQQKVSADVLHTFQAAAERLEQSGIAEKSLKIGDKAPIFTLPNVQGRSIASEQLLKNGPLAISFYRGSWCPYCNLELMALQRSFPQIKDIGAQLVAVSPEQPKSSEPIIGKHGISFEELSDAGNKVARQFGLVFTLDKALQPFYLKAGNDLPAYNGDDSWEIPLPATYVVNTDSTITHAFVDPDYTRRLEPSEIIKAVKEMVFLSLKNASQ